MLPIPWTGKNRWLPDELFRVDLSLPAKLLFFALFFLLGDDGVGETDDVLAFLFARVSMSGLGLVVREGESRRESGEMMCVGRGDRRDEQEKKPT